MTGTGNLDAVVSAGIYNVNGKALSFDVTVARSVPSSLAVLDIEITSTGNAGGTIKSSPGLGNTEHQSRSEYKDTYGKVYNGDEDDAAHE